jgi:methionyl aminopeptidase
MIYYKSNNEVELIRKACLLVGETIAEVAKHIKPGVSTMALDKIAFQFIKDHGAEPAFLGYEGSNGPFPATCCISVNSAVVHGIPNNYELQEDDIISVDTGTILEGFYGDSAYTFALGAVQADVLQLMTKTKESLYLGIVQATVGKRIGDISWAVQEHTEIKCKYGIVRELSGHGLGRELHEEPEVPNYGKRGNGLKLQDGLVIAIEPMVNLGKRDIYCADDDWTIITKDNLASAHYEHTICVRKDKADILSSFLAIEAAEKNNTNLISNYY